MNVNLGVRINNTLAVRGLEDPRNFQELLTESVGPLRIFPDLSCLFRNIWPNLLGLLLNT